MEVIEDQIKKNETFLFITLRDASSF